MKATLLNGLLTASAERYPDHVAVRDRGRSLTYAELETRANQVAGLLQGHGITRGDRVGLYLDKSAESLIGIYGVLKSGAAYVPFDPQAPPSRLAYISEDAGIGILLTGAEKSSRWGDLLRDAPTVETLIVLNGAQGLVTQTTPSVQVLTQADLDQMPTEFMKAAQSPSDLAYVLYTSGSTGEPKGVMLSHQNALAFVDWTVEEFGVASEDRLSSHAPLHFDLSVFDLFAASAAGSTVVLVPATTTMFPVEVARLIEAEAISIWYSVPSALSMLITRGAVERGAFPQLRTILFAGEVFPMKYLVQLMELLPHVGFHNLYGPTETNVCTWYTVPRFEGPAPTAIPIGRAIPGVAAFAADQDGNRLPQGEVGELFVGGPTVMQGYWGDPERSARTLSEEGGRRVYRTGDLVQEDGDGNFLFLGRRDTQIKSRGYRIELGEIEGALYEHPEVLECAAIAVPDELVTNRIRAVVATRSTIGETELIEHCRERLPRYMIPEQFEFRTELPKSSTGKIARKLLLDGVARG